MRRLGQTDLMVSDVCLGGNVFGWTTDEKASCQVLDGFVDAGLNFIDTADVYSAWVPGHSGGESETIIGRWMAARGTRSEMVIAVMRERRLLSKSARHVYVFWISKRMARRANGAGLSGEAGADAARAHPARMRARPTSRGVTTS